MKKKDTSHHNYDPTVITEHIRSSLVKGVVVKLYFKKVRHLSFLQFLLTKIGIYKYKYIYFWLPYRNVMESNNKYSVVGSNSRFPYAKAWFEVKECDDIYKQGWNDFIFQLHSHNSSKISITPFTSDNLFLVSRKKVIKILDAFVFTKQNNNITVKSTVTE